MANDETEVKLRVRRIYQSYYGNESKSVEAACEKEGISRGTLRNWSLDYPGVVDAIRAEVAAEIVDRQRDQDDYVARAKASAQADLTLEGIRIARKGLVRMESIIDESKSDFNAKAAFDSVMALVKDGLMPSHSKIVINAGQTDEDKPKQLATAPRPYQHLPPPGSIQPTTSLELASEVIMRETRDGVKQRIETRFPDVLEGEKTEPAS